MDYLRRGNKELIKDINRALVIDRIRSGDPISRTEIAQRTKLGLSTITKIIDGLLDQRLVKEVGEGDSSGGRRPIYVDFNYNYGFVVGIKIEKQQVILATTDLRPTVQHKLHLPFTTGASADTVMREIEHGTNRGVRREQHVILEQDANIYRLFSKCHVVSPVTSSSRMVWRIVLKIDVIR